MKFVIFADKSYNYIRPIADGLYQTLKEMGQDVEIWYDGIYWLQKENLAKVFLKDIWRIYQNMRYGKRKYICRYWNLMTFYNKKRRRLLGECDCIIVVQNCPGAFNPNGLKRLDFIRVTYPKPIVNYDFHYLPNQAWWGRIQQFPKYRGLEMYDWYLPIGLITEFAIPTEIPQIYDSIGMDVNSPQLYPEQQEFIVLLDFPRSGHEEQRAREKKWLSDISVPYVELKGRYTTNEIRKIYRSVSAYVVSSRESFGLPIIELQLCGAVILTPHLEWVPAHFLNKSPFENGIGSLGKNFRVFSDEAEFKQTIQQLKKEINYIQNVENFKTEYPKYDRISKESLATFIQRVEKGEITKESHISYAKYNQYISDEQDYEVSDLK